MSLFRSAASAGCLVVALASCASSSNSDAISAPTSVPPALAFADAAFPGQGSGLWTEVASNEALADCLREGAGIATDSIDELRDEFGNLGELGRSIISDCLPGA